MHTHMLAHTHTHTHHMLSSKGFSFWRQIAMMAMKDEV